MWFKNLQVYRFNQAFELDAETLGTQLEQAPFVACSSQETSRSRSSFGGSAATASASR